MSQCYHLIIIYPKAINKSPQAVSLCEYGLTDLVIPLNHCAMQFLCNLIWCLLKKKIYSDLDSADFESSKFIAKLSTDVATTALLDKIVLEVNCRGRSFEVN